jgi:phage terminase Nu1 subunit (DNA packaging protein)
MPELSAAVTMVAFAKLHGVSRAAAYKWKARGLIVHTANGRVDVAASNARLDTYGSRRRSAAGAALKSEEGGPQEDPLAWSTPEAIRRREIATAQLRRIEADRAAGKVAAVEDTEREWTAAFAAVRAGVLAAPSRVAARLPNLTLDDLSVIDDELRAVLAQAGGDR